MINKDEFFSFRWEHIERKRYYKVVLYRDLLGDWVVTKVWGSINTSQGRVTHIANRSLKEAKTLIEKINQIRLQRGYIVCP